MYKTYLTTLLLSVTVTAANAGQIQIGQYASNTSTGADSGLTKSYILGTNGTQCVGQVFQGNTCVTGSTPSWTELGYDNTLFNNSSSNSGSTLPTPYTGYQKAVAAQAGSVLADTTAGETFAMISDGVSGSNSNNFWGALNNTTITIPVGVLDVSDVWTMIDNVWGRANSQDTKVFFNFGTTSNATTGLTVVEVDLTNAPTPAGQVGGQVATSVSCTSGNSGNNQYSNCISYAAGTPAVTSTPNTYVSTNASANATGGALQTTGITVTAHNLYTFAYTNALGYQYTNTSGNDVVDDQGFNFGTAYNGLYLVSIGIGQSNSNISGSGNNTNPNLSLTALSAITLDTFASSSDSSIPEPSTWLMVLTGSAIAVAFAARSRRA